MTLRTYRRRVVPAHGDIAYVLGSNHRQRCQEGDERGNQASDSSLFATHDRFPLPNLGFRCLGRPRGPTLQGPIECRVPDAQMVVDGLDAFGFLDKDAQGAALILRNHKAPQMHRAIVDDHVQAA